MKLRALSASRPATFAALWVLLLAQIVRTTHEYLRSHPAWGDLLYPMVFVPASAVLAFTRARVRWLTVVPRLLIAIAFLDAVADRLRQARRPAVVQKNRPVDNQNPAPAGF